MHLTVLSFWDPFNVFCYCVVVFFHLRFEWNNNKLATFLLSKIIIWNCDRLANQKVFVCFGVFVLCVFFFFFHSCDSCALCCQVFIQSMSLLNGFAVQLGWVCSPLPLAQTCKYNYQIEKYFIPCVEFAVQRANNAIGPTVKRRHSWW